MSRRVPAAVDGLVIVDKPAGLTSHDVVARVRRIADTRQVGHAGTLDPMATGVLVLGVGRATRLLTYVVGADKTYAATIRLGVDTVTDDAEGAVLRRTDASGISDAQVAAGIQALTGVFDQVPSTVSAIKIDGRRAHARVRAGESVELAPRRVTVRRFEVLAMRRDGGSVDLDIEVEVSSGTYVRALARDLGGALGVGGHLTSLRRAAVGPYDLARARTLEQLESSLDLMSLGEAACLVFPARDLSAQEVQLLRFGARLSPSEQGPGPVAALAPGGELVALVTDKGGQARSLFVVRTE